MALAAPATHAIVVPTAIASPTAESDERGRKADRAVRDTFSMPPAEHAQLKSLREALAKAGRLATKSELLRAGLQLLAERSPSELAALVDALPPVLKGKRGKKH